MKYQASGNQKPRIIVSSIEHESVLETARDLEQDGVEVIYLPVDKRGVVDLKKLKESLNENTVLVSIMYVNNEIGTVQPISEIAKIIGDFRASSSITSRSIGKHGPRPSPGRQSGLSLTRLPLFHVDASQAFQFFDCDVKKLGVDMMTLSAHKMYGPKGSGALYVSSSFQPPTSKLQPLLAGGGQEFGLRSGTENVPAIVGFAKAVELSAHSRELAEKKIGPLRDYFWRETKKIQPKAEANGILQATSEKAKATNASHILNIYFPGHAAQDILTRLDLAGISASSGSACRSRAMESSYVIEALKYSRERAKSSVRFSFGQTNDKRRNRCGIKVLKRFLRNKGVYSPSEGHSEGRSRPHAA